ncbi:MAG: DUF4340 domain-containing protein [Planctomycetes bacterium]|nr:DUF4340 domain-containing protein [Planctomycetota bacterium]
MSWRTLLVLVLLVLALAWFATRTARESDAALAEAEIVLFPGVEEALVTGVRLENVARDLHLSFERDERGAWRLTDPVVSRAEPGVVELVVRVALRARGAAVPREVSAAPQKLGLEPPRFVLDLESEREPGARPRTRRRVEVGAAEVDGLRVFARVDGRIALVSRELETVLDRELHEFRASSISDVDPRRVLEVRRRGSAPTSGIGPTVDLGFDAVLEAGAWRATAPLQGLLDPAAMALYVQSFVVYRYEREFDEGARTLAVLGLDPPELSLTFGTTDTEVVELLVGRPGADRSAGWLGTRRGSGVVWTIPAADVEFLCTPLADLLDHRLLRVRRGSIARLEIEAPDGSVRLERDARGWSCLRAPAGSREFGAPVPAEAGAVEDVLGALERYELAAFLPGVPFDPGPEPVRWRVEGSEGGTGGAFGAAYVDATGAADVLFQRAGETVAAHGDPAILAVLRRDPELFLSLSFLETNEADLGAIELRAAGGERRYERNAKGVWTRPGGAVEARELRSVLEALLFLRAAAPVPRLERAPLVRPIEVALFGLPPELGGSGGLRARFQVGLAEREAGARAEIEYEGRRGVARDARLHARLEDLLSGG